MRGGSGREESRASSVGQGHAHHPCQHHGGAGQARQEPALVHPEASDERGEDDGELAAGHHVADLGEPEGEEDQQVGREDNGGGREVWERWGVTDTDKYVSYLP